MRRAGADRNNSEATAESPKSDHKMGFSQAELVLLSHKIRDRVFSLADNRKM
jgi:hypothetical protein